MVSQYEIMTYFYVIFQCLLYIIYFTLICSFAERNEISEWVGLPSEAPQ